jgi:ribosomal protein S12 methylthiotransferase accessory factor YcaO
VSQGKGIDLDAATASGLMEAVELYHAEHIERPLKLGSMANSRIRTGSPKSKDWPASPVEDSQRTW